MKQYIILIIIIIIIITFNYYTSYNSIFEGATSTMVDSNQIIIDNSESLRDFLGKLRSICYLDENSLYNSIKPNVCYKINKLYNYFYQVKDFLKNKSEEQIFEAYGPQEQTEIAGKKVGPKPDIPIISSNYDYNMLILLVSYIRMLKPYSELEIWYQNDNGNPPSITSHCSYNDKDSIEFVKCAKEMLTNITLCLDYFQYQTDDSNIQNYGDGLDTGTGAVPIKK